MPRHSPGVQVTVIVPSAAEAATLVGPLNVTSKPCGDPLKPVSTSASAHSSPSRNAFWE